VANRGHNGREDDKMLQVLHVEGQLMQIPGAHSLWPNCLVPALSVLCGVQLAQTNNLTALINQCLPESCTLPERPLAAPSGTF